KGGQPVQLTDGPGHDVGPSWSPDGKSLVYCSLSEAGGQWELWVVDTTAGGPRRFIGNGLFPQWSPVGDTIVFQRSRQRGGRWFSIWTLELVDGEPRYPTEIASSSEQGLILPAWTADGGRIAYSGVTALSYPAVEAPMVGPAGQADIWVVDADGSRRIRMTSGPGAGFSPVFSPDGRIYFTRRIMGLENIWSVGASPPGSAEARLSRIDP
ncbi:MAG: PD40 domain-containing protein, partial [Planctomycetes bacterium]|nr:PD40 domain-containing protein [Planctomycetota bacterium]